MSAIRFADFQKTVWAQRRQVSLNDLAEVGRGVPAFQLTAVESLRLVQPYVTVRLMDQVRGVVPLAVYLVAFKFLILDHLLRDAGLVTAGLLAVIVGLMLFMEGLKIGLMPLGNLIGSTLPKRSPLPLVLGVTLILGVGVTFAEPAISALKAAGANVSIEEAPYLYALLTTWSDVLVLVVGVAVGLAAVLGTLRFVYGWSLKPLIYFALTPTLLLTIYASQDPELVKALGLAWDTGAVTTGPVTVPLVLSLGIGIAAAAGKGDSGPGGFGIVTLASLFPVTGVLLLALFVVQTETPAEIMAAAALAAESPPSGWYETSPGEEIVLGFRAILPLVLFLLVVQVGLLREKLKHPGEMVYGIALTVVGMCLFNVGLTYGLSKLGGDAGALIPSAFMSLEGVEDSPIYPYATGVGLAIAFAWLLGFGATVAEPALNALGVTAEELTNGVFQKRTLIFAVSTGVAFGISLGVAKLVFDWPLVWLIVPGYATAIVLTWFSSETFVNVAWDSAGVTTGPITVPLVLAMGLGIGSATGAVEGFGILCMASIGPIISVLLTGLWSRYKVWSQARSAMRAERISHEQEGLAEV